MFDKLFGRGRIPSEKDCAAWNEFKDRRIAAALGPDHDTVLHAILSYEVGGALHTYFYRRGIPGTGIATKQLARLGETSPKNFVFEKYELVMFTRDDIVPGAVGEAVTPDAGTKLGFMRATLNAVARYAEEAELNPGETLEFPSDFDPPLAGRCYLLDAYQPDKQGPDFGLMLVMELFRDELDIARSGGKADLLTALRASGAYPYSDLDQRASVAASVH